MSKFRLALCCLLLTVGCALPVNPGPTAGEPKYRIFVKDDSFNGGNSADEGGYLTGFYWTEAAAEAVIEKYPKNARVVMVGE